MTILALSSSRAGNSAYLEPAFPLLKEYLGTKPLRIAFIPFAAVGSYDDYFRRVQNVLRDWPYQIDLIPSDPDMARVLIMDSQGILVGGGNTFKLLHDLYKLNLVELIRNKAAAGCPYIGWSAGANILGETIGTTNDMPIIQPASLKALRLLPFQINPHYHNISIEGFNGETRDQRIEEFLILNPSQRVVALPEGSALVIKNNEPVYRGSEPGVLFYYKQNASGLHKELIEDGWKYRK